MPAAILGRMSVGEKSWVKPDELAIASPKGSRARRDEDNARVDSSPTVFKWFRLNRLLIQLRRQTAMTSRFRLLDPFIDNLDFDNRYLSLDQKKDQNLVSFFFF